MKKLVEFDVAEDVLMKEVEQPIKLAKEYRKDFLERRLDYE